MITKLNLTTIELLDKWIYGTAPLSFHPHDEERLMRAIKNSVIENESLSEIEDYIENNDKMLKIIQNNDCTIDDVLAFIETIYVSMNYMYRDGFKY